MGLFGKKKKKKKEEEEGEEEDVQDEKQLKKKKRKPRKKKKVPPKPWGKKERKTLAIFLLGTILISAFLSFRARSWKLPGLPRLSIPKFKVPILGEEKIVIEGDISKKEITEEIIEGFKSKTYGLTGVYGLYVFNLDSSISYGVEQETVFQAASLIKLPVMVGMYLEEELGKLNLDDTYILREEDKVGGSGSLSLKSEGYEVTYRELIQLMGKQSDNTAYNIALYTLGKDRTEQIISSIGMENTSVEENKTTPEDIGLFFKKLWEGAILKKDDQDELLSFLTNTIYEDHLAAGIPSDIRVAHKYGREVSVVNDAGIVYTDNPYVVVLMGQGVMVEEADLVFPELSRFIYEAESADDL
ncbi:serine hydrolase [Candidatus Woesebacteria bacterium]|nr:serine hydrolase [Candidatus Woesebacteria bacterium]